MKRTPRDLDFAPEILRLEHAPPAPFPRLVLYLLLALFLIVLVWASFGRLDIITVAEGRLVPQNYLQIVQPAEPGILREILVKEGEHVQAGQILMRMDSQLSQADNNIVQAEIAQRTLQMRRIDAELSGGPLIVQKNDSPELFHQVQAQYVARRQAYQDAFAQEQALRDKGHQDLAAAEQVLSKLNQTLPV
jgi:hemolysin D